MINSHSVQSASLCLPVGYERFLTRGPAHLTSSKRFTCRVAQWLIFSDTWNAIVDELRSKDLLSEKEKRNLNFQHLPIDDTVEVRGGSE